MKKRLMEGSPGRKEAGTWKETSRIRNEQMLAHSKDITRHAPQLEALNL